MYSYINHTIIKLTSQTNLSTYEKNKSTEENYKSNARVQKR